MASTSDFMSGTAAGVRVDTHQWGYKFYANLQGDGLSVLRAIACRVFGIALVLSGLGLWVLPGSDWAIDSIAMKAGVTICCLYLAVMCLRDVSPDRSPEVHVDLVRKEVRMIEVRGKQTYLLRHYRFADLGECYVKDHALHMFDQEGEELAVVDLDPVWEARLA